MNNSFWVIFGVFSSTSSIRSLLYQPVTSKTKSALFSFVCKTDGFWESAVQHRANGKRWKGSTRFGGDISRGLRHIEISYSFKFDDKIKRVHWTAFAQMIVKSKKKLLTFCECLLFVRCVLMVIANFFSLSLIWGRHCMDI
jgi:hypothetical protein